MKKTLIKTVVVTALIAGAAAISTKTMALNVEPQISTYSKIVHANYNDAYEDGLDLQKTISTLLSEPNTATLEAAKKAWLKSRNSYGQTEAFRFYEGPIDFVDEEKGVEGPEGKLNAWPLNEAYIDYVKGDESAGIINNGSFAITKQTLAGKNQEQDEADVSTGYHAIEFLLWGQDLSLDGPGNRPVSDFTKGSNANERRRSYLQSATDLLVDDLKFLKDSWESGKENYAAKFVNQDSKTSLSNILTALATLSGFELSAERMATSLDSGDQEDEHSCFSDNTHNDFIMNAKGISNVFFGRYGSVKGASIYQLLKEKDEELAEELEHQIFETAELIDNIPYPIDREVLATPKGSPAREKMELAVASLQKQADLFKKAGVALGLDVQINE